MKRTNSSNNTAALKRTKKQFLCAELYGYLHGYHKLYNKVLRRLNAIAHKTQFEFDASHIYVKTTSVVIPRHLPGESDVTRGDVTCTGINNLMYDLRLYTEKLLKVSSDVETILDKELVKYDIITDADTEKDLKNKAAKIVE